MRILSVFFITLGLSAGLANAQTNSLNSTSLQSAILGLPAEKILEQLHARVYAKLDSDKNPVGCFVANISRGICAKAYYQAPHNGLPRKQHCLVRRVSPHFSINASIPEATLPAAQVSALRSSIDLYTTSIAGYVQSSPASAAKALFAADFVAGRCNKKGTVQTAFSAMNIGNIAASDIGSSDAFKFQIYKDGKKFICLSKEVKKTVLDANCTPIKQLVKVSDGFCNRLLKIYMTKNSGSVGTKNTVTVAAPILPISAALLSQVNIAAALESLPVLASVNDASFSPAYTEMFIEPRVLPVFESLNSEAAINQYIAQDPAHFAELTSAVIAIDKQAALDGVSASTVLGSAATAYSAIKSHFTIAPIVAAANVALSMNDDIAPRTVQVRDQRFNDFVAANVPAVISSGLWGIQQAAGSVVAIRPKRFCRELAPASFSGLSVAQINSVIASQPVVVPPRTMSAHPTIGAQLGGAFVTTNTTASATALQQEITAVASNITSESYQTYAVQEKAVFND